ncbi:hypothetical protein BDV96DRAFT_501694 [Lophiotrema nucula]|uniref:RBR-type E3 ubiquitin transferase n=1 Tax=Lophiotrema nucula TaxID=690887 RepID=A0A6A5YT44_9PLEO|nr:hypothetical protein BDV96DRAFT_501694 [Lophiotrema nucula]
MRDCAVCGDSFPIRDLPALVNCTHEPQTCATCFQTWIETELNSKSWNTISCPWSECRNILQHYEVQQYATQEVYDRFDKLSARSALNDDPNFYNCMARNCDSGQFHYRDEHGTIFRCVECDFHFCIVHKNTWHEGETCEEYDYRISGRKEADQRRQEEASEKAIKKLAKKCPGKNCNYHIEKNEGCDHMTCRCQRCRHEFCWECLAPYKAIRARSNAAHNPGCKYHSDNIR